MKVILLENIRKIGSIGEIIDVKRGFARNFLLSKKKALFASKENIKEVEVIKQKLNKKDKEWMMFRNPPPQIKDCFLKFVNSKELKILSKEGKPENQKLFKKGRKALKNCAKQNN